MKPRPFFFAQEKGRKNMRSTKRKRSWIQKKVTAESLKLFLLRLLQRSLWTLIWSQGQMTVTEVSWQFLVVFVVFLLPSPCTASFQALSVNAFGDVSETNGRETPRQSGSAHAWAFFRENVKMAIPNIYTFFRKLWVCDVSRVSQNCRSFA